MVGQTEEVPRVALIVGGAGGIGWATARAFGHRGYSVVVADLAAAVERLSEQCVTVGSTAIVVDVLSRKSIDEMYEEIGRKFGRLDVLVNCAGNIHPVPSGEADEIAWDRLIDIHLTGTFRCCQGALALLGPSSAAAVVNMSSVLGRRGVPRRGILRRLESWNRRADPRSCRGMGKRGIRVNCIVPGYTLTPMNAEAVRVGNLDIEQLATKIPLGRLASAEEIAAGIVFLASSEASYITGQTLVIDGGLTVSGLGWGGE